MLCQGIVTGLGCGFSFGPCIPALSHWFQKRRSTAIALISSGSAIGGTVIPIAVRNLIPAVGFKWTMRILGFFLLFEFSLAILLVKRRLPPVRAFGGLLNLRAFQYAPYTLYVGASCIAYLGLFSVLTYIDVSGLVNGLSPDYSFYLVAIANAGSLIGRIGSGPLCDKFGNLNVLIPFNLATAATTFAWPFCKTLASLTVIAALYGIAVGAFAALVAAPVASLGDTSDVGRRTGMLFTLSAVATLIGPPISGAIFSTYERFLEVGIYAGCMIAGSSVLMFAARWSALGGKLRGRF
ncbi:hypothetical protein FRC02_009689 [Tulasnella sp. 418]|nr:hypothetical protein FRC02_009689 [Tulasnella sp. 418]